MAGFVYELRHDYCAGILHCQPEELTKEEGEDSVVVKHQQGYGIKVHGNIIHSYQIYFFDISFLFFFFFLICHFVLQFKLFSFSKGHCVLTLIRSLTSLQFVRIDVTVHGKKKSNYRYTQVLYI